jgi:hypothetical protein
MTKTYRTKPKYVKAVQWTGDNLEEVQSFAHTQYINGSSLHVSSNDRSDDGRWWMKCSRGYFIVKDSDGIVSVIDEQTFKETYEEVE